MIILLLFPLNAICQTGNNNENLLIEEIEIICISPIISEKYFVIKNKNDYYAIFRRYSDHPNCIGYNLPQIDFDRYTLIGINKGVIGCDAPVYKYNFYKENNIYFMEINITQIGFCKVNLVIFKAYLISKLLENEDIKIIINVENENR